MMRTVTENANVELNHVQCEIPKGARISIIPSRYNRNLYVVEESSEVVLNGEKYVLEDGDIVELSKSGPYFVSENVKIRTDRGHCLMESGDRITIKEGWFDWMDVPLFVNARKRINRLLSRLEWAAENADSEVYDKILASEQFHRLKTLSMADTKEEIASYIDMGLVNPTEDVESIAASLEDAGETKSAKYVRRIAPRTLGGKIWKWLKRTAGADSESEMTARKGVATKTKSVDRGSIERAIQTLPASERVDLAQSILRSQQYETGV